MTDPNGTTKTISPFLKETCVLVNINVEKDFEASTAT